MGYFVREGMKGTLIYLITFMVQYQYALNKYFTEMTLDIISNSILKLEQVSSKILVQSQMIENCS